MKKFTLEAVIKTTKGDISVYLYPEAAPKSVANFVFLAKNNFYNGLTFHRVIPNVLVQGGDPLGNGTGGTGYVIDDEISYSSAFKRKKLYNIVMRVFAPIFLIVILVSAILNTLGFISL